jgi:diguanylate cyclase (GGDEF)-like protein
MAILNSSPDEDGMNTENAIARWLGSRLNPGVGGFSLQNLRTLIFPSDLSPLAQRRRAAMIQSRARLVALMFTVLTPLWVLVDLWLFGWPKFAWLALMRLVASLAFGLILATPVREDINSARKVLVALLAVPLVFFGLSHPIVSHFSPDSPEAIIAAGYAFLPFIMISGLAVFPLAAIESALLACPMLLAHFVAGFFGSGVFPFESYLGALWLLVLTSVVSGFAAMSQLHFLNALVAQSSRDALTGALVRRDGEEVLLQEFMKAQIDGKPMSIVFVDLDKFKTINDTWGHEAGDVALNKAARALRRTLRGSDVIVRWGGEEFVVGMPACSKEHALEAVARLRANGFDNRPDGTPQTASIGVAEWQADAINSLDALTKLADDRMYVAKKTGRDRVVSEGDGTI